MPCTHEVLPSTDPRPGPRPTGGSDPMALGRGEAGRGRGDALFLLTTEFPCGRRAAPPGAIQRGCLRPATRRDFSPRRGCPRSGPSGFAGPPRCHDRADRRATHRACDEGRGRASKAVGAGRSWPWRHSGGSALGHVVLLRLLYLFGDCLTHQNLGESAALDPGSGPAIDRGRDEPYKSQQRKRHAASWPSGSFCCTGQPA